MLKFFKNLFGSGQAADQAEDSGYVAPYAPGQNQSHVAQAAPVSPRRQPAYAPHVPVTPQPAYGSGGNQVRVSLQSIVAVLPIELKTRVQQTSVNGVAIDLPLEHVLAQLAGGAVRISFGDLRAMAPDFFSLQQDRDHVQIVLPLNEILPQINPAFLPRRSSQRQVEVPDDVRGPFGNDCFGVTFAETKTITGTPITGSSSEALPEPPALPTPPPAVPRAVQPQQLPPAPFAPIPRTVQPPQPTPPTPGPRAVPPQRPMPQMPMPQAPVPQAPFSRAIPPRPPAPALTPRVTQPPTPPIPTTPVPRAVQPPTPPAPGPRIGQPPGPPIPAPFARAVQPPTPPAPATRPLQPPTPTPPPAAPAKINPPVPPAPSASPIPFRGQFGSQPTPPAPAATPPGIPPVRPAFPPARGVGTPPSATNGPRSASAGSNGNQHNQPASPPAPQFTPAPQATPARQSPQAVQPPQPGVPEVCLDVPLAALCDTWPVELQNEIVQQQLSKANLALPVRVIEPAMRQGKIAFPWKVLRSWIRPAVPPSASAHDGMMLELPLSVLAPLFLSRKKEGIPSRQKLDIDDNIPNLFFGFPQPDSAAPAAEAPVAAPAPFVQKPAPSAAPNFAPAQKPAGVPDTNFYVWGDSGETPQVDETEFKRKPSVGTEFLSRYATPNEVVSRAAALDGVAGALVALPDGLMVASKLSADLNGDTLAAFLPHIFGKVSQCTKELRMGELNNLHFTVGNVPWKIFRVNAIFFAAFGRAGQPLPTAQLAALAAELDRKKQ